jgi:transposase
MTQNGSLAPAEGHRQVEQTALRYPSDLTDQEWALIEAIIPPARRGGNKRTVDIRRVVDGLMFVLSTGCQWTAIPRDLPPRTTLNEYFRRWSHDRTLGRIQQRLGRTGTQHAAAAGAMIHSDITPSSNPTQRTMPPCSMRETRSTPENRAIW